MSLALARKYRPHTFNDLIGQETVSKTLSLALEGKRLSHAYLFSGLRGSGKTSTARIFAKALLCEKGETSNPCGTCAHCSMAIENRHIDIIEMDAASNRGIDDIKDLIEHTKYKPSMARYKIFIIDEVHMLTNQAFNALLKTLEEPPDFVKFILATTDPLKLPTTILSRTQHFRFKKIPQNLVLAHLEHILTLENIQYESHALNILARSGAGSLRDSLTLLDQAIVYSKNFVNVDTVTGMLGIIEPTLLEQLLRDIYQHDRTALLAFITQAANYEAEMVLDELTLLLKSLLLSETKFEGSQHFSILNIERFFRIIAETKHLLFLGSDGEFILSLTLFKMMESLQIKEIDQMITNLEKELQGNTTIPLTPVSPQTPITSDKEPYKKPPISTLPETLPTAPSIKITKESFSAHLDTFKSLIVKLYDRNYELGKTFESNINFISFEEQTLKWGSTAQEEHKKRLITHWGLINMFVKECFGVETKIVNIPQVAVTPQSIETPKEEEMKSSCIAPEAGETEAAKEKDPSTLLEETMVKEAIALFDPKKVRIKRNT